MEETFFSALCGLTLLGLMFALIIWAAAYQRRLMNIMRANAERVVEQYNPPCPVCEEHRWEWGTMSGYVLFLPRAVKGRRSTVAALRCGNCGHMLLFAQSPETIKRKNRPADEAGF